MARLCTDCNLPRSHHIKTWIDEFAAALPRPRFFSRLEPYAALVVEHVLKRMHLASMTQDFSTDDILPRSALFIEEARSRGIVCYAMRGPTGVTNNFSLEINSKIIRFETLPTNSKQAELETENKEVAKQLLARAGFPIAEGRSFWVWQVTRALKYGAALGFPLVVKPRSGSVARHVTTAISSIGQLREAIKRVIAYSPAFMIERYIDNAFVHRATVVDFSHVAVVRQTPAHVVGDGTSTIGELIAKKNRKRARVPRGNTYDIVVNDISHELLHQCGLTLDSVVSEGDLIYIQRDPHLALGGDLLEVTPQTHVANTQLFSRVARHFGMSLVGIDFIAGDIQRPWTDQECAILELNNVPCIELHQYPTGGTPVALAGPLLDMCIRDYLA